MDTPAHATETEPPKAIPPKVGWMVGEDMEHALLFAGIGILAFLAAGWLDRNPVWLLFILLAMPCGILFSLSGLRTEKGLRRLVCAPLLVGWILYFLWVGYRWVSN